MRRLLLIFIFILSTALLYAQGVYSVDADGVNIRQEPSVNSPVIKTLHKGSRVTVTAIDSQWASVSVDGKLAWISSQYITYISPSTLVMNNTSFEGFENYPVLGSLRQIDMHVGIIFGIAVVLNLFIFLLFKSNKKLSGRLLSVVRLVVPFNSVVLITAILNLEEIIVIVNSIPDNLLIFVLILGIYSVFTYMLLFNTVEYIEIISTNAKIYFPMIFAIFSWAITISLTLLCYLYWYSALPFMFVVIGLCQLYIVGSIWMHTTNHIGAAILTLKYLLAALPTAILLSVLIAATTVIGILILLIYGVLGLVLSGSMSFAPSKCVNYDKQDDAQCSLQREKGHKHYTCPYQGNKYECPM